MSAHLRYGVPSKVLSVRVPADKYDEIRKHIDAILYAYERRIPINLPTDIDKLYLKSLSCPPQT